MPKQYVTIEGRRVAVSEITTKEKPFPFSNNFHDESTGELWNDINNHERNIHAFRSMKQDDYTNNNIKELLKKISDKKIEILNRVEKCEKHKLRFGAN